MAASPSSPHPKRVDPQSEPSSASPQDARNRRALRNQRQREDARRAILDATESVLVEGGPEGLSMRTVARRSGYAAPTIYHYFGDKPGLIDALLEERFGRLLRRLQRVPKGEDPAPYLAELARAFVHFGEDNPSHYRLLSARSPGDRPPPLSAERARDLMEGPLIELEAQGRLRGSDRDALLQTLWALIHGIISLTTSRPDYDWSEGLIDAAIDTFLHGVLQPPTPAPKTRSARPRGASH